MTALDVTELEDEIPPELADSLAGQDTPTLRRTIDYIRAVLRSRDNEMLNEIEARPGEELVRVTERDGYTEVVKRHPCVDGCPNCPHDPYLYHVHVEERPDGERTLTWNLIGRIREEAEESQPP